MAGDELQKVREVAAALRARPTGAADLDDVLRRSRRLRRRRRTRAGLALFLPLVLVATSWAALAGRRLDPAPAAGGIGFAPATEPTAPPATSQQLAPEQAPPAPSAQSGRTIGSMAAGGNVSLRDGEAGWIASFRTLNDLGASVVRVIVHPAAAGWAGTAPAPERLDRLMQLAHDHRLTPVVLLQAYDGPDGDTSGDLGGYDTWQALGRAYAGRFAPGGAFQRERGIAGGWGVTLYQAITRPRASSSPPVPDYVTALRGLADGVHAVDPGLAVIAGGLRRGEPGGDPTLAGYGPALAPLLNAGTLAGLDLHTYYDPVRAPMEGGYEHSAQDAFDEIKRASGITADIAHHASNWGYRRAGPGVGEEQVARGVLTAFWDNLGVVGDDGATGVSQLSMPWNLFLTEAEDPDYGMAVQRDPWIPNDSGRAVRSALAVAADLHFVTLDPRGTGEYVLEGSGRKLWVWQNRQGWTDHPGDSFTVTGLPASASHLEVHGWDGLRRTIPLDGQSSLTVTGLPADETLMFLARPAG